MVVKESIRVFQELSLFVCSMIKIPHCTCAEYFPRTCKATPLHKTLVVSVCLGWFTERSYTHADWYNKVRRGFESLSDSMLAKILCSEKGC